MKYGDYTISKSFSIKIELWDKFMTRLTERGLKVSDVIVMLIERWLNEDKEAH